MEENNKKWYAIYTKPRCEKKVHQYLTLKQIESYCPVQSFKKRYTDRYKVVEEPLFKSYVFVNITQKEITEVRLTVGVVNFVYWLHKPAVIANEDIITIKKFLNEYVHITLQSIDLKENQRIIVTSGLFMQHKGTVKQVKKNKVVVYLDSLGVAMVAELHKSDIILA